MEKKIIIVGAGLVGSLWAVYMQKAGYQSSNLRKKIRY
jgi:glycine/D-amino acid oxidase-like deaminating enzyme